MKTKSGINNRAVAYARFSTEMQREESIDAQLRAIESYASSKGYILVNSYIDRAKSATTDKRPEFQRMIADAEKGVFDVIIVHKLDRFSRDRYDSAIYKHKLKSYGVKLFSVTENLDGSPESVIMESVIEAMAEYYSANLAREVEKGRRENALKGEHVGGVPPLGYDIDKTTRKLVINEREAAAVRTIFSMYLEGCGYGKIIEALNAGGYQTKRGQPFRKNSIYEILRNEKYTGKYVYNKSAAKSVNGTYNRHAYKEESDIIRVDGVVPEIISKEDFDKVQELMKAQRYKTARNKAKQEYLLSGKLLCGECGSSYAGNARKPRNDHPLYISYRCTKRNGAVKCRNPEVRKERIEDAVLKYLAKNLFDESVLPELMRRYGDYVQNRNGEVIKAKGTINSRLTEIERSIANIVNVVMQSGSISLSGKLRELETEKAQLENRLCQLEHAYSTEIFTLQRKRQTKDT